MQLRDQSRPGLTNHGVDTRVADHSLALAHLQNGARPHLTPGEGLAVIIFPWHLPRYAFGSTLKGSRSLVTLKSHLHGQRFAGERSFVHLAGVAFHPVAVRRDDVTSTHEEHITRNNLHHGNAIELAVPLHLRKDWDLQ